MYKQLKKGKINVPLLLQLRYMVVSIDIVFSVPHTIDQKVTQKYQEIFSTTTFKICKLGQVSLSFISRFLKYYLIYFIDYTWTVVLTYLIKNRRKQTSPIAHQMSLENSFQHPWSLPSPVHNNSIISRKFSAQSSYLLSVDGNILFTKETETIRKQLAQLPPTPIKQSIHTQLCFLSFPHSVKLTPSIRSPSLMIQMQ